LWFPKQSETFIFREVVNLWKMGLPLKVFTLYGELTEKLAPEMRSHADKAERLGIPYLKTLPSQLLYWRRRDKKLTRRLMRTLSPRRWSGLEKTGENLWAFLCGFYLARRFEEEGIEHIHASWAGGPATAAWIASRLTGIPFSFTARAWDIYPPDRVLKDKIRDAAFVRSETNYNINYMRRLVGPETGKMYLTYNGVPLESPEEAPVRMKPPYQLVALGRFVGKKGYEYLLEACKIMQDSGTDFQLTLAGDGPRRRKLEKLTRELGLSHRVTFPGFVSYDRVSELFQSADLFLMPCVLDTSGDRDGIPTVIMEALEHRVPVIASDVSGISEVIEDRVTGLLIPERDAPAISNALRQMLDDREAAVEMAERGRAKVRKQFDPDTNHRMVFRLYEEHSRPAERKIRS